MLAVMVGVQTNADDTQAPQCKLSSIVLQKTASSKTDTAQNS